MGNTVYHQKTGKRRKQNLTDSRMRMPEADYLQSNPVQLHKDQSAHLVLYADMQLTQMARKTASAGGLWDKLQAYG